MTHIGELQVNLKRMLQAKENGHEHYKAISVICEELKIEDTNAFTTVIMDLVTSYLNSDSSTLQEKSGA